MEARKKKRLQKLNKLDNTFDRLLQKEIVKHRQLEELIRPYEG